MSCTSSYFVKTGQTEGKIDCYVFANSSEAAKVTSSVTTARPATKGAITLQECQGTTGCSFSMEANDTSYKAFLFARPNYLSSITSGIQLSAGKLLKVCLKACRFDRSVACVIDVTIVSRGELWSKLCHRSSDCQDSIMRSV